MSRNGADERQISTRVFCSDCYAHRRYLTQLDPTGEITALGRIELHVVRKWAVPLEH